MEKGFRGGDYHPGGVWVRDEGQVKERDIHFGRDGKGA